MIDEIIQKKMDDLLGTKWLMKEQVSTAATRDFCYCLLLPYFAGLLRSGVAAAPRPLSKSA